MKTSLMLADQFRRYPTLQQWQIARNHGRVILSQNTPNHEIIVYQLKDFFVETWQNLNNQMLDSLVTYKTTQLLEKHAEAINIDDLYR